MLRTLFASVTALTFIACSDAPPEPAGEAPTQETASLTPELRAVLDQVAGENYGWDIVEGLTTDIGPRLAGSPAEARAREWTADKFREIGLDNVRIETFDIPGWVRGVETATLLAPFEQPLYITALGGSVATPDEGIEAEIAYFPTFEDLEAAPEDMDLSGKIVFISGLMDKAPDGAGYGPANRKRRSGASESAKRGAEAVIIRSVGTDSHRFPHTGQMRYELGVPRIPIGALSGPDADQLERLLERGETLSVALTLTPREVGDIESGNVVGEIVGADRPDEIVLIGGHLDSWDLGTGALDDAAGVAISAGAAQAIIESGQRPSRTIRVVAFGAEEVGLLGGRAYAEQHEAELSNHVLASESDFGGEPFYEVLEGVSEGEEVIEEMARILGVPMSERPKQNGVNTNGGPDIGPMFSMGVPAMRLQQDGTDYFDFHHTPDDTLDKLDPEKIRRNVEGFAVLSWLAANAETDFRADEGLAQ